MARGSMEQTMATMEALLEASDRELVMPSSHGSAQGKDVWALITNDVEHEKIHTEQVLEGRYESRITASPMERLAAEWLVERARFIGSLIGLTDDQFNSEAAPGQWTYRAVAKHVLAVEQDLLKTMAVNRAVGPVADPMKPQILLYAPVGDKLELTGAEWFIPLATGIKERPALFGQPFDGPMEGHPPTQPPSLHHYDLHVWLFKPNPAGVFKPFNPGVKCPKAEYTHTADPIKIVPHH